jgi:hypothetical protein
MSIVYTEKCQRLLDICNIPAWHRKGIDGSYGVSATPEFVITDKPYLEGMVKDSGGPFLSSKDAHGTKAAMIQHIVAPGRKILSNFDLSSTGADIQRLLDNHVDVVSKSQSTQAKCDAAAYAKVLDYCTLFASAGNDADEQYNKLMLAGWHGIGALRMDWETGKILTEGYTSESPEVDFAGFAWVWYLVNGTEVSFTGTSCACPWVAGQAALINHIPLSEGFPPLTAAQMKAFMKRHAVDVDEPGVDVRTGYGYIKLPAPDKAKDELFRLLDIGKKLYDKATKEGRTFVRASDYLQIVNEWSLPA